MIIEKNKSMIKKTMKNLMFVVFLLLLLPAGAQNNVLTLEQCRKLALESNNNVKISDEKVKEAEALKNMAFTEFFPKLTANGTYTWNQKNICILSDEQQNKINNMGTTVQDKITPTIQSLAQQLVQTDPQLAVALMQSMGSVDLAGDLNAVGKEITDAFNLDMHNVYAGAVTVSQPVFMGGRITELYKTARTYQELAGIQCDKDKDDLLIQVDEAYWRVVSVQSKQKLALQYCNLLEKLSKDVAIMVQEGVATQSDVLKVNVKLNEAQMSLTKADNGLALSKMLLYQLCGLDLNGNYELADERNTESYMPMDSINMEQIWAARPEIKMLQCADEIAKSGVHLAAAGLMPNIAVQGSYVVTNPNLFNGYENKFGGMFTAGVVVNIPICHAGDFYAVKAAKCKRNEVAYQLEDAKGKIQLQVNKNNYELDVANKKLKQAQSNLKNAEENLRLANESFNAGVITSNDLMGAQTAWQSAQSEVIDAGIEVRLCNLYLQQSIGMLNNGTK